MPQFAARMDAMANSALVMRRIFSAMNDPEIISFGGGAPANETLPVEQMRDIATEVLGRDQRGLEALQYGSVKGVADLRREIAHRLLAPKGITATQDDVLVTCGGLETMNMVCQLFIEPGDVILIESPTYVQVIEIFQMFEANCIPVDCDEQGMVMADLEAKIKMHQPKIIYVIPTFQNPTGKTLPLDRRRRIAELGSQYDVLVLEDDPYESLRYSGEALPAIKHFDETGHTVYAGSLSKVFSPGSRLGYAHATGEIMARLVDVKTATNSHSSMIAQVLCAEYFTLGLYEPNLQKAIALHKERRDVMMKTLEEYMPEGVSWVYPDGGLFTWVTVPDAIDTSDLLIEATNDIKVAYVAGAGFFAEGGNKGRNTMRVSFGNVSPDKIETGIKRLADLIRSKIS